MRLAMPLRAVLLVAVVLAACGDTAGDTAPTTGPPVTATLPPAADTTTTSAPVVTTTTPAPVTTTTAALPTTTAPPPTTTTAPPPEDEAGPPPTAAPTHGGLSWAVYMGAWQGSPDDAAYQEAVAPALAAGYDPGGLTDVACDQGAAAALGVDPAGGYLIAGLYFATEADARDAAAAIGDGVDAVGEVQTYCLD